MDLIQLMYFTLQLMLKDDWRSDAVRSEPIFWDGRGHKFQKFWRLRGYSGETDILLQGLSFNYPKFEFLRLINRTAISFVSLIVQILRGEI